MSKQSLLLWFKERWEALVILGGALIVLTGSKFVLGPDRLEALETRVDGIEAIVPAVDGLALSECLKETNPIARSVLECGRREAEAGVRR